jgi:hypothetical protein
VITNEAERNAAVLDRCVACGPAADAFKSGKQEKALRRVLAAVDSRGGNYGPVELRLRTWLFWLNWRRWWR